MPDTAFCVSVGHTPSSYASVARFVTRLPRPSVTRLRHTPLLHAAHASANLKG
jgi:hypothetical protein